MGLDGNEESWCNLGTQSSLGTYYRGLDVLSTATVPLTLAGGEILAQCGSTRYQDLVRSTKRADEILATEIQAGLSDEERVELEAQQNPYAKLHDLSSAVAVEGNLSTSNLPFYVSYIRSCPSHIALVYNEGTHLFVCDATDVNHTLSSMDRASLLRALHELRDDTSTNQLDVLIHRSSGRIADVSFFYNNDVLNLVSLSVTGQCSFWAWNEGSQKWIPHTTKQLSNPTVEQVVLEYNSSAISRATEISTLKRVLELQVQICTRHPDIGAIPLSELQDLLEVVNRIPIPCHARQHIEPVQASSFVPAIVQDVKRTPCPVLMVYLHQYIEFSPIDIGTEISVSVEQCFTSSEDLLQYIYLLNRPMQTLPQPSIAIGFSLLVLNGMSNTLPISTMLSILEDPVMQHIGPSWDEFVQEWRTFSSSNTVEQVKYDVIPKLVVFHQEGCTLLQLQGPNEPLRVMYVKHIDIVANLFQNLTLFDNSVFLPTLPVIHAGRQLALVEYTDTLRQILSITLQCSDDVVFTMEPDMVSSSDLMSGFLDDEANFSQISVLNVCFTLSSRNNLVMACCNHLFSIQIEHNTHAVKSEMEHAFFNNDIHPLVKTSDVPGHIHANVLCRVSGLMGMCSQCKKKTFLKVKNVCVSCSCTSPLLHNAGAAALLMTPDCLDITVRPLYQLPRTRNSVQHIHIFQHILISVSPFHVAELTSHLPESLLHWFRKIYPDCTPNLRSLLLLPKNLKLVQFHSIYDGSSLGVVYSINNLAPMYPCNLSPLLSHPGCSIRLSSDVQNYVYSLSNFKVIPPHSLPILYNSTSLGFIRLNERESNIDSNKFDDIQSLMQYVFREKYHVSKEHEQYLATEHFLKQMHPLVQPIFAKHVFGVESFSMSPLSTCASFVPCGSYPAFKANTALRLLLLLSPGTSDITFPTLVPCKVPVIVPCIEQKRVFESSKHWFVGTALKPEPAVVVSADESIEIVAQGLGLLYDSQSLNRIVNNVPSLVQAILTMGDRAKLSHPSTALAFHLTNLLTAAPHKAVELGDRGIQRIITHLCSLDKLTEYELSSVLFSLFGLPDFHSLTYSAVLPTLESDGKHGVITYPLLIQPLPVLLSHIDPRYEQTGTFRLSKSFSNPMTLPFLDRMELIRSVYISKQRLSEFDLFVGFLEASSSHNTLLFVRIIQEYFQCNAATLSSLPTFSLCVVKDMTPYVRCADSDSLGHASAQIERILQSPEFSVYGFETKEALLDLPSSDLFTELLKHVTEFLTCRAELRCSFERIHVPLSWLEGKVHENDVIMNTQFIYEHIFRASEVLQMSREDWCAKQALMGSPVAKAQEETAWRQSVERSRAQDTFEKSTSKLESGDFQRAYDFLEFHSGDIEVAQAVMAVFIAECTKFVSSQTPTPWDILCGICSPTEQLAEQLERNTLLYIDQALSIPAVERTDVKKLNARVDLLVAQGDYCRAAYEYIRHMQTYEGMLLSLYNKEQAMLQSAASHNISPVDVTRSDSLAILLTAELQCTETLVYLSNHLFSLLLWCNDILGSVCIAHECNTRTSTARQQLQRKLLEVSATVTDQCHDAEVEAGVDLDYTCVGKDANVEKTLALESSMSCLYNSLSFVNNNNKIMISNVNNNTEQTKTPMLTQLNALAVITQALPVDIVALDVADEQTEWFQWRLSDAKKRHVEYVIQNICIKVVGVAKRYGCYHTTSWDLLWNHGKQQDVESMLLPVLKDLCNNDTEVQTLLSLYKIQ